MRAGGMRELPSRLKVVSLEEVCEIVRGLAFPTTDKSFALADGTIACLRTTNAQREVEWDDLWFISEKHIRYEGQFVRVGDILISTANSFKLVGKVAQVNCRLCYQLDETENYRIDPPRRQDHCNAKTRLFSGMISLQ